MADTMNRSTMAQNGPQDLMWLTASGTLDAFRDSRKQNEARRHVMKDYLRKEHAPGRRDPKVSASEERSTSSTSPDAPDSLTRDHMLRLAGPSTRPQRQLISPSPTVADHPSPAYTFSDSIAQSPAQSTASSTKTTAEEVEAYLRYYASQPTSFSFPEFLHQFNDNLVNKLSTYEFESITFKTITTLPRISVGKPTDPFNAMPEGFTPSFDVQYIKYHCIRYFATGMTKTWWAPLSNVSLHSFFSNLYLCAVHLDVMKDQVREPQITTALRADSIIRISRCTLAGDVGDSVIQSIVHVILVDLINGDLTPLQFHEDGIKRIVELRGGLSELGLGGVLANTLSIVAFMSSIHRETPTSPLYHPYVSALPNIPPPRDRLVPESPLYAPYATAFKTFRSNGASHGCRPCTIALLQSMRELTDLFLGDTSTSTSSNTGKLVSRSTTLARIHEIYSQTLASPSADEPNTPYAHDMVYESIRLTSLIYVTAIHQRIPLSIACSRVPIPPSMVHHPSTSGYDVLEALRFAVRASNRGQCWLDLNMTGVFYWVTLVAGASASGIAVRHENLQQSWPEEFQRRAREARMRGAGNANGSSRRRGNRAERHRNERIDRTHMNRPTTTTTTTQTQSQTNPNTNTSTAYPESASASAASSRAVAPRPNPTAYSPFDSSPSSSESTSSGSTSSPVPPPETRFLRKWFAALNMQSMALLAFQHPAPVVRASWRMARVVEALVAQQKIIGPS